MLILLRIIDLFSLRGIEKRSSNISKVTLSSFCPRVYLFVLGKEVMVGVNSL